MAVGDWSAVTLCTYSDLQDHYPDVLELTGESGATAQSTTNDWCTRAQEEIGLRLDDVLRQKYAQNDYTTSEDLKDHISNATVLQLACIYLALAKMFKDNVIHKGDYYNTRQLEYEMLYGDELDSAIGRLRFDQDKDGSIDDPEMAQGTGRYRFDRV